MFRHLSQLMVTMWRIVFRLEKNHIFPGFPRNFAIWFVHVFLRTTLRYLRLELVWRCAKSKVCFCLSFPPTLLLTRCCHCLIVHLANVTWMQTHFEKRAYGNKGFWFRRRRRIRRRRRRGCFHQGKREAFRGPKDHGNIFGLQSFKWWTAMGNGSGFCHGYELHTIQWTKYDCFLTSSFVFLLSYSTFSINAPPNISFGGF